MQYQAVVGLEVHVHLKTRTKIFCRCLNQFGAAPNTLICPVCAGYPGSLPVLNRDKRLVGIVSLGDVALSDGNAKRTADALNAISQPGGEHSQS